MKNFHLHINGAGNAWPVLLGENHPFYNREKEEDLANASFSILGKEGKEISSELLIDAGHGIIQYLLKHRNRIPEAMVISHPHLDHTLSLDWIAQSYYKKWKKQKRYPVYSTEYCFEAILVAFPHLKSILEHKALVPGEIRIVDEIPEIALTAFPVYHGNSAYGASAIMVSINEEDKILFTGDILSPLFRKEDYRKLTAIPFLVGDANNRFPYPKSNHWSIISNPENTDTKNNRLADFRKELKIVEMIEAQKPDKINRKYLLRVQQEFRADTAVLSMEEMVSKINPGTVLLYHYSGDEDFRHYQEDKLSQEELKEWVNDISASKWNGIPFQVPIQGDEYML